MTTTIPTTNMSHMEWLATRRKGIGSSDVGAILGLNPYRTAYDVYLDKVGESIEQPSNKYTEFGLKLENVIAETYAERNGRTVVRDDVIRFHPEHHFLLANIDRLIEPLNGEGVGVLELKTASGHAVKNWESEIPLSYFAQIQHQMYVGGFTWGAFALLVDGRDYSDLPVKRDDVYLKTQVEMLLKFWNENVLAKVPPTPTVADLEKLKPTEGSKIEANDEIAELCIQIAEIKSRIKAEDDTKDELEKKLKEFIGTNEVLIHKGITLATWKQQHRKAFAVAEKSFRVLKLSKEK